MEAGGPEAAAFAAHDTAPARSPAGTGDADRPSGLCYRLSNVPEGAEEEDIESWLGGGNVVIHAPQTAGFWHVTVPSEAQGQCIMALDGTQMGGQAIAVVEVAALDDAGSAVPLAVQAAGDTDELRDTEEGEAAMDEDAQVCERQAEVVVGDAGAVVGVAPEAAGEDVREGEGVGTDCKGSADGDRDGGVVMDRAREGTATGVEVGGAMAAAPVETGAVEMEDRASAAPTEGGAAPQSPAPTGTGEGADAGSQYPVDWMQLQAADMGEKADMGQEVGMGEEAGMGEEGSERSMEGSNGADHLMEEDVLATEEGVCSGDTAAADREPPLSSALGLQNDNCVEVGLQYSSRLGEDEESAADAGEWKLHESDCDDEGDARPDAADEAVADAAIENVGRKRKCDGEAGTPAKRVVRLSEGGVQTDDPLLFTPQKISVDDLALPDLELTPIVRRARGSPEAHVVELEQLLLEHRRNTTAAFAEYDRWRITAKAELRAQRETIARLESEKRALAEGSVTAKSEASEAHAALQAQVRNFEAQAVAKTKQVIALQEEVAEVRAERATDKLQLMQQIRKVQGEVAEVCTPPWRRWGRPCLRASVRDMNQRTVRTPGR